MLQHILDLLPVLVPVMIAVNVILGGLGQLMSLIHQNGAAGVIGKIAGLIKSGIDLIQGNLPH
jgi:hypothetical protein